MDEQRREDRAAREAELFRLFVENVVDYAIFIVDAEGLVETWSHGAARLLGYSEGEILGRTADIFFTPEDVRDDVPRRERREAIDTGRGEDDRWHVRKDGTRFWASGVTTPLWDEGERLRGFAKLMRDRTDWWHAEQVRREGEARKAAILEAALDCIIAIDHEGKVVEFNPAAERTFGLSRSEVLGREMAGLIIPPEYRDHHRRGLAHYLSTGEGPVLGRRIEITAMRADGSTFPVELAITPISTPEGTTFTAYLRDLTEQEAQGREIAERRRLAEFGRDVGVALTERVSLDEMLDRVARETVRHLDGAFARIWAVDEAGATLELKASAGMYTHLDGDHARIPLGMYKIGQIARDRRPHLTNSVLGDPSVPAQDWAKREGMVAFAGYPLVVEGRLVGVWAMFARHPLSGATLEAMASVASGIAGGIERKRAEEWLVEQRQWLQVTIDSIGDAVISTDGEGRVVFMNPVAEGLTGWPRGEAAGRPLGEVFVIVNEYTRRPAESPVGRVLKEGVIVGLANHTIVIGRDGRETAIEDSAAPIKDASGRVAGVVMVFQDATERRLAERLLRESEERAVFVRRASGVGFWYCDLPFDVLQWDELVKAHFHLLPDARITIQVFYDRIHPDDREPTRWAIERSIADGTAYDVEYRTVAPDTGSVKWIRAIGRTSYAADGKPARFDGVTLDVTDRKHAEEQLQRAKREAEDANASKDRFLAMLSHELRTPLNPILLAASSMLDRTPEPEELRPTLEMIRQNVKLQARLIDDLLDVMRIVQGKMPLHWGVSDCHALIGQSIEICRSEFFGKAQEIVLDLDAEHHHVNADSARLHQVLWNLVRNAVKFTPDGGTIAVRTRNEGSGERNIVIEVADTGIGIEPDVLPTIWDPFQQGETTITRRFGGLGLGLAICKGIVDAHGGTLTVQSEGSGRGTTFRVVLKAMPEPPMQPEGRSGEFRAFSPLNRLNILLVEDEAATLRLMARLLKGLGHQVTAASTVADAWAAFQAGEFDMIVSDIGLPDGTGLDLMRKVKAVRRVPAIALTGYGMDEDVRRSRDAGFTTHMTKPIDFRKLEAMIRQVAN